MVSTRASAIERTRTMPADSMIPKPSGSLTSAVTINASPSAVWPWLIQMGAGRAGWYSYDFLDNGRVPSSWSILTEHQSIAVGDVFPALPGAEDAFVLAALDPGSGLVLTASFPDGSLMVTWEFLLQPHDSGSTRLLVRGRLAPGWPGRPTGTRTIERVYRLLAILPKPLMRIVAGLGHMVMERKMLRGIKRRSEQWVSRKAFHERDSPSMGDVAP